MSGCTRSNPLFGDDESEGSTSASASAEGATPTGAEDGSTQGASDTNGSSASAGESTSAGPDACGDGHRDPAEECDRGADNDPRGECQLDCTKNECGDGLPGPGQPCDDGAGGSDTCTAGCVPRSCGDGEQQGEFGEECDDGNPANTDGCLSSCELARCGDGFVHEGVEACDDANDSNEDGCLDTCEFNSCGDGFVELDAEACDTEQPVRCSNGLTASCEACEVLGCECGDGLLDPGEQCDVGLNPINFPCGDVGLDGDGVLACAECHFEILDGMCCAPDGALCGGPVGCCNGDDCNGICGA